jgi:hypothetical protein
MGAINQRLVSIGIGVALGCLFSGCTATTQVPPSTAAEIRVLAFIGTMAGPFCAYVLLGAVDLQPSPIAIWQMFGILSIPLIVAHPIRPSVVTGCISAVGLVFWFWAGLISIIYCFYAG